MKPVEQSKKCIIKGVMEQNFMRFSGMVRWTLENYVAIVCIWNWFSKKKLKFFVIFSIKSLTKEAKSSWKLASLQSKLPPDE